MTRFRRRLSRLLASLAYKVNPDPPLNIKTVRRIDTPMTYASLRVVADAIGGTVEARDPMGEIITYEGERPGLDEILGRIGNKLG
jgi:hypothetical protein